MLFYHNDKYLHPYLFCAPTSPYSLYCHGTLKSRKTFSYFNNKRIKDKVPKGNSTAQSFLSIPRKIFDPHRGNREQSLFPCNHFYHFAVPRTCILIDKHLQYSQGKPLCSSYTIKTRRETVNGARGTPQNQSTGSLFPRGTDFMALGGFSATWPLVQ